MSQRAIIAINGDLLPFNQDLDAIRTYNEAHGSVTWLPAADTDCVMAKMTANGSYHASELKAYGYDTVNISVPGTSAVGKDPDTGEEMLVTVNSQGVIVRTVIASSLVIVALPTKTNYVNGETIDYSGLIVNARSNTGQDMGAVPYNQLIFPVKKAKLDQTTLPVQWPREADGAILETDFEITVTGGNP